MGSTGCCSYRSLDREDQGWRDEDDEGDSGGGGGAEEGRSQGCCCCSGYSCRISCTRVRWLDRWTRSGQGETLLATTSCPSLLTTASHHHHQVQPGAPWTTVGIKPPAALAPPVRPLIPGGSGLTARSVSSTSIPTKPTVASPRIAVSVPSRPSSRTPSAPVYDADSPPPPSAEFMKWCRDALKGLTVPNSASTILSLEMV